MAVEKVIYIDENINGFDLQQALQEVTPQRREQALRYRNERDQRLCVAAYRLLQRALLQEYGISGQPELIYDQNGKPSLAAYPDIHISLSHCREAVACAVSDQSIGIDVETFEHYSEEVARRALNDEEMRQVLASPRPDVAFTRLWTMKESLFKLTGDDHGGDIAAMLDHANRYCFSSIVMPRCIITVCSAQTAITNLQS